MNKVLHSYANAGGLQIVECATAVAQAVGAAEACPNVRAVVPELVRALFSFFSVLMPHASHDAVHAIVELSVLEILRGSLQSFDAQGGADGKARVLDAATGATISPGTHDDAAPPDDEHH
jgi:hypothetical protein